MFSRKNEVTPPNPIHMQQDYWKPNTNEKSMLLTRYPDQLSWSELLRLHHLNCAEILHESNGKTPRYDADTVSIDTTLSGENYDLYKTLTQRLLAQDSPYRSRHVGVMQGQSTPEQAGVFRNASATHLGSLEVIWLDEQQHPKSVGFIAFDEIQAVMFANPALFRAAKVFFDDQREPQIVLVPLLYGISWFTKNEYDRNGSMTRFCCHITGADKPFSIGIGHQDFTIRDNQNQSLFGIGSVSQIVTSLEMVDPRFDQKCRARGIDPDQVRKQNLNRPPDQQP